MLKNLKSLFIKDGDLEKGENSIPKTVQEETSETNGPVQDNLSNDGLSETADQDVVPSSIDTTGSISEKFMDILLGAMKKSNREGFDYMEYKQSLQSLKKMEMDEATRFKSAFAMAQTMGASKQNIADSAKYYLDILNQEKEKFNIAVASQNSKQVISKQDAQKDVLKNIEQKELQIQKLQEEISALKQKYQKSKQAIAASKSKVQKTNNDFIKTYDVLRSQIEKDVNLINQYL